MYAYVDEEDFDAEPEALDEAGETWVHEEGHDDVALKLHDGAQVATNDPAAEGAAAPFDMRAFERIVREHGPRLASFVRRRIGNPSDVEDVVQDTFVEAIKGMDRYRGHSRPETWIFGIALNLIRTHYKRGRVRDTVSTDEEMDDIPAHGSSDPARLVEHREILARLNVMCDGLSDETREMLELVFDECLTYEQAAGLLGVPVGTIRSRISRVRLHLRQGTE